MQFLFPLLLLCASVIVQSATDPQDVQALGVFYSSLNSPPQLSGWSSNGSDPCGESWKGITCSGSAVTSIQIPGLGLNGILGYTLADLLSLRTFDLSNNKIHDTIPYQLPPNLTYLNLADNKLVGNIAYSISTLVSLVYLNLSHNLLSQTIGEIFENLQNLSDLDLSFNNLTGDLPTSVGSLSNLSSLSLQDNQLTGQVNILTSLVLTTLDIANNNFSGWIPREFRAIPNLSVGGNSFANGPALPPPPYAPPPRRPRKNHNLPPPQTQQESGVRVPNQENGKNKKGLTGGQIAGMVIGSVLGGLCVALAIAFCLWSVCKANDDTESRSSDTLRSPVVANTVANKEVQEQAFRSVSQSMKPPPAEKMMVEKAHGKNGSVKRSKLPITATAYTVASLQTATNSFSQESLVGEGSLGRVYRAGFSNGKVLAVKKLDSAALSLHDEDNFLEAVSSMSRLRHPNITALVGYCVEHEQRLLVYEYIENGTLHDMLHYAADSSALTWNARVRVALGTARALEYLHEVCLPAVVHRNFKSANILLDEDLNPHLSDCGLAALTPNTKRQLSTEMVGSFGYSSPEFAMSGIYTVKSDVYSFGVVMLELLTGRKPLDSSRPRSEQSLVGWATPQLHDIDALAKMVDPALSGMYPAISLSRFADVIALCIQPEPEFRPPISEVVQSLVRLMQRASAVRRWSGEDLGISYRISKQEAAADLYF